MANYTLIDWLRLVLAGDPDEQLADYPFIVTSLVYMGLATYSEQWALHLTREGEDLLELLELDAAVQSLPVGVVYFAECTKCPNFCNIYRETPEEAVSASEQYGHYKNGVCGECRD